VKNSDIKVLIVEDDPIIAEDLYSLLTMSGYKVVGVAHDGAKALDRLAQGGVDFAILDIHLGSGQSGIDIAEVIHEVYEIPYIFLTSFDDEHTLTAAQQNSPFGYLVKPFHDRSLLTTIKIALTNYQSTSAKSSLSQAQIESKIHQNLTPQEYMIILQLIKGLSYKQIASSLHISPNTVKYHAGNIYNKCDVQSRSELPSRLMI